MRWGLFLVGLSLAFVMVPVQTLALEALKGEALAKASSLFLSTRLIFASVGVAIVTTLFVDLTQSRATDLVKQGMALVKGAGIDLSTPRVVAALRAIVPQIATQAGTWAVQSIFWLIFFGSLSLIVLAMLLPGRKRRSSVVQAEEAPDRRQALFGVLLALLAREAQQPEADQELLVTLSSAVDGRYPQTWSEAQRGRAVAHDFLEPMSMLVLLSSVNKNTASESSGEMAPEAGERLSTSNSPA